MNDELLRDALVFGVDSDTVRNYCIAEGNKLTLQKAREIALAEEATKTQLAVITNYNQVNILDKKKIQQGENPAKKKTWKGARRSRRQRA